MKYATNMHKICNQYAPDMHLICTWYALAPDMHIYAKQICKNMQAYAEICIGAYIAYLAYICTPHFADVGGGAPSLASYSS